jgi:ribonuclease BN (tRNA processing enzyme)
MFVANEIREGIVYTDDLIKVEAFRVKHTSFEYAFGYRIRTPDRSIVISGDCAPAEKLNEHYRNLDLLIHEVYSAEGFNSKTREWKNYHSNAHTSTKELALMLKDVRPRLTVLYHQLGWGFSPADILNEIRTYYDGDVRYGSDLEVF